MSSFVRNRFLTVQRGPDGLVVQTVQCGTDGEAGVRFTADPQTFTVRNARWERHRSPDGGPPESIPVPELDGIEAYFQKGAAAFRRALGDYPPLAVELFIENIRALIQAESFLCAERGYPSLDAYVEHWKDFYVSSCRYYSNLDRVETGWGRYVGRRPGVNLFNRFEFLARQAEGEAVRVRAVLSDSFHEMVLDLLLAGEDLEVRQAAGAVLRAPDRVCFESSALVSGLEGARLAGKSKKEIAPLLGGPQGCVHLISLAAAAAGVARPE